MRQIFLYLLLVGMPVIAVLGVLRFGQRLQAPMYVGGTWKVEQALKPGEDSSCGASAINFDGTDLAISQSGTHLFLTLNDENRTAFTGEIHGETITASIVRRAPDTALDARGVNGGTIQLRATVERDDKPDCLICTLTFNDCLPPAGASFTAKRQAAGVVEGR